MKRLLIGIKNILLWSYARGTWQYDILCILIIGTVFLVPSSYFGDRDRPLRIFRGQKEAAQANETLKAASKGADTVQWDVWSEELEAFLQNHTESEQLANNPQEAVVLYLREHLNRAPQLTRPPEPQLDGRGQVIGYRVWFR